MNDAALEMFIQNNEPETALDILRQAYNELKLSKPDHSKENSIAAPENSCESNKKQRTFDSANKVKQFPAHVHPENKLGKHYMSPIPIKGLQNDSKKLSTEKKGKNGINSKISQKNMQLPDFHHAVQQ